MSVAFVDSSGLVKRYVPEPGSDLVEEVDEMAVAEIARVEVVSALWRRHRDASLSAGAARTLTDLFQADWYGDGRSPGCFTIVRGEPVVLDRAAALLARHPLRAGDAIQLASALAARDADDGLGTLVCFDDRLRDAAAIEGFSLLP